MKSIEVREQTKSQGVEKNQEEPSASHGNDAESRLQWLVGFIQETDTPDTAVAIRTLHQQLGDYLNGVLIRRDGQDHDGPSVITLGDSLNPDELPMAGEDNQKPLDEKLALIRTGLRRILKDFLTPSDVPVRVTGEIAFQRILEKDPLQEPKFREQWVAADVRDGIKFRLLEDLVQAGTLLRQCPARECAKLFVRRYRQEFCSHACRNRTNVRHWQERKRQAAQTQSVASQATKQEPSTPKTQRLARGTKKRHRKKV